MKRFLLAAGLLVLFGAGCVPQNSTPSTLYENQVYGFSFRYPDNLEAKDRSSATQPQKYLGLDAKFFMSLRDLEREAKPVNLAFFYAVPRLTADEFKAALTASGTAKEILKTEEIQAGAIKMTKIINATDFGQDKIHYLFDRGDQTIIVSVFLDEEKNFDPLLASFK